MSGPAISEEPVGGAETEDTLPTTNATVAALFPRDFHDDEPENEFEAIIREIVGIERGMFFERRHSKAERQRRIREVIERHTKLEKA